MNTICIDPLPPVGLSVVVFFTGLDVGVDCHVWAATLSWQWRLPWAASGIGNSADDLAGLFGSFASSQAPSPPPINAATRPTI